MPTKKKALKTKTLPKSKAKKPEKKEKKAVSKKIAPKKVVAKPKAKIVPKKAVTVKKAAPKKQVIKAKQVAKSHKVTPKTKVVLSKNKITKAKVSKVEKKLNKAKNVSISNKVKTVTKAKPSKEIKKVVETKVVSKPAKPVKVPKAPKPIAPEKLRKQEEAILKKQIIEQKSKEVLAINNSIPITAKNEISQSKIASISHSITNPVKRTDAYSIKPEKEPNGKFELEFVVHASAEMIYEFISTPSGLSEWFCDDLNIRNGIYTFIWEDTMQQARLLKTVDLQLVRFQWVDKMDGSYFELRIQRDDLTNDISLMIIDFAESVADRESAKLLWHNQIEKLMHVLGSVF